MSGMITAAGAARWLTSSALRSSMRYRNVSCHQPQSFSGGPYPALIGYHPGRNALIAMATDTRGQITGGQFIHLDRGSWCDTYQQLYRLIRDLSVSPTNSRSFQFHFPFSAI